MKRISTSLFSNIPLIVLKTFVVGILVGMLHQKNNFNISRNLLQKSVISSSNIQHIQKSQNLIEKIQTILK